MTAHPNLDQIRELPLALTTTVRADFADENGHMNVRHYFDMQDQASVEEFNAWGIDETYPERTGLGVFTLEQHTSYLGECVPGDAVTVHLRVIAAGEKTLHIIGYLVNDTRGLLAHVIENVIGHVDLSTRRMTPWPEDIAETLAKNLSASPDWAVRTAGCIGVR